MADIDFGQLSEALNDKSDRDLRNVDTTAKADAVIDFQLPTADNGYTWYRLYASGWVEQGGRTESSAGGTAKNITFPVAMADTNYTAQATIYGDLPYGSAGVNPGIDNNNTTTGMTVYTGNTGAMYWQVSGMAA